MKPLVRNALLLVAASLAPLAAFAAGELADLVGTGAAPPAPWRVVGLPSQTKPFTRFSVVEVDGRRAVKIEADSSYGNLVHALDPAPAPSAAGHLSWQWRLEQPLAEANLREKAGDDTGVKVCVFFDEPMEKLSFADRQFIRIARGRTSDPVPTATLCYVWDPQLAVGTALDNAYTRRVRYIVLESGSAKLDRWVPVRRDLRADFLRSYGAECDVVPPVVGVAIGADADNTRGRSVAYVTKLALEP